MDFVESYLVEVQRHLPEKQRRDILRELRTTLEEQIHELADEQHRPPTDEDELKVLGEFGHPLKVASGYRDQRYLIGPELYPTYLYVLKLVLVISFVAQLVGGFAAVAFIEQWEFSLFDAFFSMLNVLGWVAVIVTLVFIVLEYSGEKLNWYDNWKPNSLSRANVSVANKSDVISNFVTEGVFLLWWNDVLFPTFGEGFPLALSASWDVFYWPLNIIFGVAFVLHAVTLLRGLWRRPGLLIETSINVALLAILFVLLSSGRLVDVDLPHDGAVEAVQWTVKVVLLVIAGFTAWDIWLAMRQLRGMRSI